VPKHNISPFISINQSRIPIHNLQLSKVQLAP
jgi:hypothetical protein